MSTVFQPNLFQHSPTPGSRLFQVDETVTPPTTTTRDHGAGVGGRKKPHRRILVEIDGESFPVSTPDEARELLEQAREVAQQEAQVLAEAALTKAGKAKRPSAKAKALDVRVPRVGVQIDPADEYAQQIQAQVDAANAALREIYARAVQDANIAAIRRAEQDEEDAITLLLLHL